MNVDKDPYASENRTARPDDASGVTAPSVWRRGWSFVKSTGIFHPDEWPLRKMVGFVLVVAVVLFLLGIAKHGIAHVHENQVGVQVDNLSGKLLLKDRVGYHLFIPYLSSFYVLDKTIQKLELTWNQVGGVSKDVKLKTADGNNVSLDLVINYKLIPEQAREVLRRSGEGRRLAEVWVEPVARHLCFSTFGLLTTEEMYDANKREEQRQSVFTQMNGMLRTNGIEVVAVIPGEFRFSREYEAVIKEKKLADQQVEEQQAQARALEQDQERKLTEARKTADARLTAFNGECTNQIIRAYADASKKRNEATGAYSAKILMADSALYGATNEATGRKEMMLAEAEGREQLRRAMAGEGGWSMVGYEYAKRLGRIRFSATPVTRDPHVQQYSVQQPGEAAPSSAASSVPPASLFSQPMQSQSMSMPPMGNPSMQQKQSMPGGLPMQRPGLQPFNMQPASGESR